MDIELKRLRQILAVVRCGSISRAAQELHITQPALSRSIRTLEERYAIRIFDRGRSGAELTSAGKLVVEEARELLRNARSMDHNLRLYASGDAGSLGVGMGPLIASLLLPNLGPHFLGSRPRLNLQVVARPAELLFTELQADRIEMLFCSAGQLDGRPELSAETVGELEIAVIVRGDHPLAARGSVRPGDLAAYPLLTGAEVSSIPEQREAGMFVCDNYHVLRDMTLQSQAAWLSSPRLVGDDLAGGRLAALALEDAGIPSRVEVRMITRQGDLLSPAAAAVRDYAREFFTQPARD